MIFTACICAIILTGCGSKYTVEEKSLVENQKENQDFHCFNHDYVYYLLCEICSDLSGIQPR